MSVEIGRELDKEPSKSSWRATENLADAAGILQKVSGIIPVAFNEPTHWPGWWWRTCPKPLRYSGICSAWPSSHYGPWQETAISTSSVPVLSENIHTVCSVASQKIQVIIFMPTFCVVSKTLPNNRENEVKCWSSWGRWPSYSLNMLLLESPLLALESHSWTPPKSCPPRTGDWVSPIRPRGPIYPCYKIGPESDQQCSFISHLYV